MTDQLSFAKDVKPLFRDKDRTAMLRAFDLWDYASVAANADKILESVENGSMPCDGKWSPDQVDTLRRWVEAGKPE